MARFEVLFLGQHSRLSARQAESLRTAAIAAWTASSDFEVHWLMQRAAVSASVALVDLRCAAANRDDEIQRFASLASQAMLPIILVGATEQEAPGFRDVVVRLERHATDDDVTAAIVDVRDRGVPIATAGMAR